MSYAILHAHDTYGSIGDSILRISEYVKKAKEYGIKHLAITNHGSLSTMVDFYETCRDNNINPIIGCEFYYVDDIKVKERNRHHLILLAKNNIGLKNLIKLHNIAFKDGFYYKPRIDFDLLEEYHEGLICTSACIAGHIPNLILNNENKNLNEAIKEAEKFKNLFHDDFYLEVQPGSFEAQKKVNIGLEAISKKCNIELVATNDVHYLNADDWYIHDYHVKDSRNMRMDDKVVYPDSCYYVMTREELEEGLQNASVENFKKAVDNTLVIGEKCSVTLQEKKIMPRYYENVDEQKLLSQLCWNRLKQIENKLKNPAEYSSRLEYELDTIHKLGFDGYFLIVKGIIDFCDQNKIPRGPGRGSAVGSLVSFLLNISVADPIKYGLMFERFLSADRPGNPDIDIDIDPNFRNKVYDYIVEKYGEDCCCFISTFNKRKARAAIKTAARILGKPVEIGDALSKLIPYVSYDELGEKHTDMPIKEVLETNSAFKELAERQKDIVDLAMKIEGYPSSMGIHPAGIVISPINIVDHYPLIRAKDKELHATSLDLNNVEKLSGIKFDLLALSSLSVIYQTIKDTGVTIDYTDDEFFNDEEVWKMIGSVHTTGLFQISSSTYKNRMPYLVPKSIQELAACLALVRGPCISSGADKKYIRIKQKKEYPTKICNEYWKVTKDTNGIIIYQEQVLKICQEIGMNNIDSYNLLKACSKKKADKIAGYKDIFENCAAKNNIDKVNVDQIWKEIMNSAKYAFNISHATAYAILCYTSAWLKYHYPKYYMCHLLNKVFLKPDDDIISSTIDECKRLGIEFKDPDINESNWDFKIEDDGIRIGFEAIKGLGEKTYQHIESNRPYSNFKNFLEKASGVKCNKKSIQLIIAGGLFNKLENSESITILKDYIVNKRKEIMPTSLKIGKTSVDLSLPISDIEQAIYTVNFPRKGE